MSFLYPLFLLAGLTILIPILIHLFNLRRYKTIYFPSTRFLKNIQLHSQKQSQVRYKLLLALRILFLASLILAFAQPFFANKQKHDTTNRLQVIYLDNSSSMSVKKGARNLLDLAKDAARMQMQRAKPGTRFILLTNDKPISYQPMPTEKLISELNGIDISPVSKSASQVFSTVQGMMQTESVSGADVYYYSDFQQSSFPAQPAQLASRNIHFFGMPVRTDATRNVFIDTAFISSPALQTGQSNQLVVKSRLIGKHPDEAPVLQLSVNGQMKSATSLRFEGRNESVDTLSFQVNDAGWQQIMLTVNDVVRFDDTFRITARSASNLSVLVLNEGQPNPYIQTAFRAYSGFRMDQKSTAENADWKQYNLVILNGVTKLNENTTQKILAALQQGQSICIFPGRNPNFELLNEGLNKIADINILGIDTAVQTATSLQQGSELVRDLFERIPDNVQLPTANWHYNISARLTANQQSILSFRNGDPLFAQYTPNRGKLYLLSTSADLQSGNFPGSYFFVPFLYQMTAQSKGGDIYALTAGKQHPAFLSLNNEKDRNIVHVYAEDVDVIPPQKPSGSGLEVYLGQVISQPGFYALAADGTDTTMIALNQDRTESQLELWDLDLLRKQWKGENISWADAISVFNGGQDKAPFPLWKVCVILALLMLAAESYLLAGSLRKARKSEVAPQ